MRATKRSASVSGFLKWLGAAVVAAMTAAAAYWSFETERLKLPSRQEQPVPEQTPAPVPPQDPAYPPSHQSGGPVSEQFNDFRVVVEKCDRENNATVCRMMIHNDSDAREFRIYNVGTFALAAGDTKDATQTQVGTDMNTGYGAAGTLIPQKLRMKATVTFGAFPETVRTIDVIHLSVQWVPSGRKAQRKQLDLRSVPLR